MKRRRRRLMALVLALGVHGVVALSVARGQVRPVATTPTSTRVAIDFVRAPVRAPLSPTAPPLPVERPHAPNESVPNAPVENATNAPVENAPDAPVENAPNAPVEHAPNAPVEHAPNHAPTESAPAVPSGSAPPPGTRESASGESAPVVVEQRPKSFLERVLRGTNGGPAPSVDTLDPSRKAEAKATDMDRARRSIERVARVDAPPMDAGPVHLELVPKDDGGFTYETGGFVADISVDGNVTFVDKVASGGPTLKGDGAVPSSGPGNPYKRIPTEGTPSVRGNGLTSSPVTGPGASVSFDPTALLLRAQGQDPYESEKSCFLDDTQTLRADLKAKHDKLQLANLRRDLERAWFDPTHSAAERRAALFAIWDECREDGIGVKARELVESFVRQHLPKNTSDGYTDDELVALNARRTSVAEFRPYAS